MQLKELMNRLEILERDVKKVLNDYGLLDCDELEVDGVMSPDDYMYLDECNYLLTNLKKFHNEMEYLQKPILYKGILHLNSRGRYQLEGFELTCGCGLEVLAENWRGKKAWIASSLEADNGCYYLVGYKDLKLEGLEARIRR